MARRDLRSASFCGDAPASVSLAVPRKSLGSGASAPIAWARVRMCSLSARQGYALSVRPLADPLAPQLASPRVAPSSTAHIALAHHRPRSEATDASVDLCVSEKQPGLLADSAAPSPTGELTSRKRRGRERLLPTAIKGHSEDSGRRNPDALASPSRPPPRRGTGGLERSLRVRRNNPPAARG